MNKETVNKLIKTREIIRKKYRALKENTLENQADLEKLFNPITDPLKKLSDIPEQITNLPDLFSAKLKKEKNEQSDIEAEQSLRDNFPQYIDSAMSPSMASTSEVEGIKKPLDSFTDLLTFSTNKFMGSVKLSPNYDSKYGPHYNFDENEWKIGKSTFAVLNNNLMIDGNEFPLTPGLQELLFSKEPSSSVYDEDDVNVYLKIIKSSGVLHRRYDKTKQYAGSKSRKYKLIVDLLEGKRPPASGSGLMNYSDNKIDYIYWNDLNELVNRLKLLLASTEAGNSNHVNEIISILEELREANVIV